LAPSIKSAILLDGVGIIKFLMWFVVVTFWHDNRPRVLEGYDPDRADPLEVLSDRTDPHELTSRQMGKWSD